MKKSAVIYVRVSDPKQAEKDVSIPSQIEQCREKAKGLEADVVKVFSDEGRTARSDSRPAFQDAVRYCEIFSPTYFICWSTIRFARNSLDAKLLGTRQAVSSTRFSVILCAGWG